MVSALVTSETDDMKPDGLKLKVLSSDVIADTNENAVKSERTTLTAAFKGRFFSSEKL